ncbi:NahK/ErcS family hybrid sensor histidine kinase/response regulator [uncultured Amaricoccus sp.]|uniref:NahK/ErcS family hybrid sensor histidine kinase/response regulator n=1 Tax=uncultured Amaricoccus sp. TaxID=339341 RepID=UPI0026062B46|nr:NahK/ErcS family hybrid sensor histidine kinase/response regulator [uncultured Amaricoccus sp.]
MRDWAVLALSLAYLVALFAIAWIGDRRAKAAAPARAPATYALSIAVYCSSWTLYGAVGAASADGFDYFAIYVGPILVMGLGWRLIQRMARVARAENVASIADFISARYGKSRSLAALVTLTAMVGLMPYFALQLKAITISFEALTGSGGGGLPGGTTLLAAVAMAAFAVLFGVRSVNANEHHSGLMLAIATESVVKLVAAVLVGGVIAFLALGGPGEITTALADPRIAPVIALDASDPVWWGTCLLSALAFLCLPRQFHVAVVENVHLDDVRVAAWAFPAYLVAINLFVMPVAIVGLLLFPGGETQPDSFLVAIPLAMDLPWLALIAFIGGLSAATGMIIVSTLALGTMLCNDVIIPSLAVFPAARRRWEANPAAVVLLARRLAVVGIIALAYLCYLAIGPAFPLAQIGLMSFAAVAQFAPALLGGMFWRGATLAGAFAGIGAGFLGWTCAVAVPAFIAAGWLPASWAIDGPLGIAALNPRAFGGWRLDPQLSGMLWSLGPNMVLFFLVSLLTRPGREERLQAERFVAALPARAEREGTGRAASLADLHELATRFVGRVRADETFNALALARHGPLAGVEDLLLARSDPEAARITERLLAGAIGSASARVVVASLSSDRRFSKSDARGLLDEASRAILSRHELLRDTLQNVRQGICAFDEDMRVALWNRRFLELIDLPPDMMRVGTRLDEIVRFNEARQEYGPEGEFESLLSRQIDPTHRGQPDVFERGRPDGTMLEVATNPLPSGGFVAVYTDVSDRYRAASELREANESLEQRIAERTHALSDAKAEAEQANRGKTRFLAAAGHDLLQPLQAAHLFLSALAERVSDPAIAQIDASLRSVGHLLGELLEVSKLDGGVTTPEIADFRVSDLLRPLGEEFSALAGQHGLGFRSVASSASVRSDPAMLRRILQNFLGNAVRYTRDGRVLIGCRRRAGRLIIEVWDSGPGIPEDKIHEIFLEFQRLDTATSDRGQGLGLGLAIVERLAGLLGHEVAVRSRPSRGSCFSVSVPLAARPVAPRAPVDRARRFDGAFDGALVLFIENDATIAGAMSELLAGWSCEVVCGATAKEGLARLGGRAPDVILSDYHLDHGRTGLEALAILRARFGADTPAALITADRAADLREATEAAGYRLLRKPVRPGALRALLTRMLSERAGQAAE